MAPFGGERDRLIHDSLFRTVQEILDFEGWFDPSRTSHGPIVLRGTAVDDHEEVPLNTLTVSAEDVSGDEAEMGSLLEVRTLPHFIDFYAEDDALGKHVIGDIRDGLKGLTAGRTGPVLDVVDIGLATPATIFQCLLERVITDRAHGFTEAHRKHWYSCELDVVDEMDPDGTVYDEYGGY